MDGIWLGEWGLRWGKERGSFGLRRAGGKSWTSTEKFRLRREHWRRTALYGVFFVHRYTGRAHEEEEALPQGGRSTILHRVPRRSLATGVWGGLVVAAGGLPAGNVLTSFSVSPEGMSAHHQATLGTHLGKTLG